MGTPTRGCADAVCPPQPATDAVGAATIEGAGRAGRLSRPSGTPPAGGRARGWPERAQTTEPLPGRPGRLSRGPMAQPSCEWLEQRGGRAQEGDGAGKGAVMRCGGVYSAACREEVLKGDYKEASTGGMVRHGGGRALSRRPAGLPEGPCSPTRSGAAVAGRRAAVKVSRPPSRASRPGRVGRQARAGGGQSRPAYGVVVRVGMWATFH